MATYQIRTSFSATGYRTYLIEANSVKEAFELFKEHETDLEPVLEDYEIEREGTDRDEVDIDLVEGD